MSDAITADVNAAANEIIVDDELHPQDLPQPDLAQAVDIDAAAISAVEHAAAAAAEGKEDQEDHTSALIAEAVAAATAAANDEGKESITNM